MGEELRGRREKLLQAESATDESAMDDGPLLGRMGGRFTVEGSLMWPAAAREDEAAVAAAAADTVLAAEGWIEVQTVMVRRPIVSARDAPIGAALLGPKGSWSVISEKRLEGITGRAGSCGVLRG